MRPVQSGASSFQSAALDTYSQGDSVILVNWWQHFIETDADVEWENRKETEETGEEMCVLFLSPCAPTLVIMWT